MEDHGFTGYTFDYRVTLGFGSIADGIDHVNSVIRLLLEHGISRVLGLDDYSNPRIMEMEPDIENMALDEYREYEAGKERRLWDNGVELEKEEAQVEDDDDGDTYDIWDIMVEDVERIK
ncbi:hypothetical protein Tco_0693838 [Tanacetum coccineum]